MERLNDEIDLKQYKVSLETLIKKIKKATSNGNFNQRT